MLSKDHYSIQNFNTIRQKYISKIIGEKRLQIQQKIGEKFINVILRKQALLSRLKMITWVELIKILQNPNFYDDLYEIRGKYDLIPIKNIEACVKTIETLKTQKKFLEQKLVNSKSFGSNNPVEDNLRKRMINEEIIDLELKINNEEIEYDKKISFNEKQHEKIIAFYQYQIKELEVMQQTENNHFLREEHTESIASINHYNKAFIKKYQELLNEWKNKTSITSQNGEYLYAVDDSSCEMIIINAWKNNVLQATCFFNPNALLEQKSRQNGLCVVSFFNENNFLEEFKKSATQIANWILLQIRQLVK